MMNKRGDVAGGWTMIQVVAVILAALFLVMVLYGFVSGGFRPVIQNIGAKIDTVLVMLHLKDDVPLSYGDCISYATSFDLSQGLTEQAIFKECYDASSHRCELYQFSDGSHYYYYPITGDLSVKRGDTELPYEVSFDVANPQLDRESKIYYAAVLKLYEAYGVTMSGRRDGLDVGNYIASGMDKDFGEFGDLFVLYAPRNNIYFMAANGLYAVRKLDTSEEITPVAPRVITPILSENEENGVLYSGNNLNDAVDIFWEAALAYDVGRAIIFKGEYAICQPGPRNSVYVNCHVDASGVVSGNYYDLLTMIYNEHPDFFTRQPQDELGLEMEDKIYIQKYLTYERPAPFFGIVSTNAISSINQRLTNHNTSFVVDGEMYTLGVSNPIEGNNDKFPVVTISSHGNIRYGLVFNGVTMYSINNRDFFLTQGNEIMTPFEMHEFMDGQFGQEPFDVNRTFSQSDLENELDRLVLPFFEERCLK